MLWSVNSIILLPYRWSRVFMRNVPILITTRRFQQPLKAQMKLYNMAKLSLGMHRKFTDGWLRSRMWPHALLPSLSGTKHCDNIPQRSSTSMLSLHCQKSVVPFWGKLLRRIIVVTAETIIYAQGGRQPSDTGVTCSLDSENPIIFEMSSVRTAPGWPDPQLRPLYYNQPDAFLGRPPRSKSHRRRKAGAEFPHRYRQSSRRQPCRMTLGTVHPWLHETQSTSLSRCRLHRLPRHHQEQAQGEHPGQSERYSTRSTRQNLLVDRDRTAGEMCRYSPSCDHRELVRAVDIVGAGAYPSGGTMFQIPVMWGRSKK